MQAKVILIQPEAPVKPAVGAPCNGCGVCCLAEPCPLGGVVSGRFKGSCVALVWAAPDVVSGLGGVYRCGALTQPRQVLRERLPLGFRWLAPALSWGLGKFARRWISAGSGCDCSLSVDAGAGDKLPP